MISVFINKTNAISIYVNLIKFLDIVIYFIETAPTFVVCVRLWLVEKKTEHLSFKVFMITTGTTIHAEAMKYVTVKQRGKTPNDFDLNLSTSAIHLSRHTLSSIYAHYSSKPKS